MKKLLFLLLLFSSAYGQGLAVTVFIPGQGWVSKSIYDTNNPPTAITNPTLTNPTLTGTVTLPALAVTSSMLAGSITAAKLVGSDITLTESQVTNLVTDLAAKQGMTVSATAATTGAMTVTFTAAQSVFTITPTGACTFNGTGGTTGQRATFVVTTSGASSFVLTWGTNFKTTTTLATGVTTAKTFCVNFLNVGGTWIETGRTTAM